MTEACKRKNDNMSSTNIIYTVKTKESITLFVRQMSCEKKSSFHNNDLIPIWILVSLTNVRPSLLPLKLEVIRPEGLQ